MFHSKTFFLLLAGLALLALAAALPVSRAADNPAQAQTSTVSGTLIDADGNAIDVATKVVLSPFNAGTRPSKVVKLTGDDKGVYAFHDVPPGKYRIGASSKLNGRTLMTKAPVVIVVEAGKDLTVDPLTLYKFP